MSYTAQNSTSLKVGGEIVCFCTRCKMDLGHTIMSMIGGMPSRVICRTCKSEHNYKPKRGIKEPGAAGSSPTRKIPGAPRERVVEKTVPVEVEWLKQMNQSTRPLKDYAADIAFQSMDKLRHPTFGEGIVQKLLYPNKIEVLFRHDLKTLIHGGKA